LAAIRVIATPAASDKPARPAVACVRVCGCPVARASVGHQAGGGESGWKQGIGLSGNAAPVAGCTRLVDPRVAPYARSTHVAGGTGLVDTRIAVDISGRAGLIQSGIAPDTRRADVSGRTRLIQAPVTMNVARRARLVDARINGVRHCGNADGHDTRDQCRESEPVLEQTTLFHDVLLSDSEAPAASLAHARQAHCTAATSFSPRATWVV
jgi:hypothetical protein